jgi:hypothetical protein
MTIETHTTRIDTHGHANIDTHMIDLRSRTHTHTTHFFSKRNEIIIIITCKECYFMLECSSTKTLFL